MRISTTLFLITTIALAATADEPACAIRGQAFTAGISNGDGDANGDGDFERGRR